jgi:predicted tellurium resistance membrane protein TerC
VIVVIELSDIVFAVDSIPASFGITTDAFAVCVLHSIAPFVRAVCRADATVQQHSVAVQMGEPPALSRRSW